MMSMPVSTCNGAKQTLVFLVDDGYRAMIRRGLERMENQLGGDEFGTDQATTPDPSGRTEH
jgi:hypothetical protein